MMDDEGQFSTISTMRKILITGGAGFVGYHLAKRLVTNNEVTIADNLSRGKKDEDLEALLSDRNVSLIEADLTDRTSWSGLGSGFDDIYHLASINGTKLFYEKPHEVLRVGILSTLNAIDWFVKDNGKKDAKILYTSSNEAYSGALEAFDKLPIPTPEDVPLVIADVHNPRWSYAGQKLIGELLFIHFAKAYNFRMSIVRPHNFYGPRAGYEHAIPQIIERIEKGEDPFAVYGADETRSFCYIEDAVEAIEKVMQSNKTDSGTYHIGSTEETMIADLTEKLFAVAGWKPSKLEAEASPEGSVKRRLADVSKIAKDTGWKATTPLEGGLKKTYEWYVRHQKP